MNNNTPPLYALTPIDQTEGLPEGSYDTMRPDGDRIIKSGNLFDPKKFGDSFGGWLCYNPPGTTYLRPLPEGTVAVSEDLIADIKDLLNKLSILTVDKYTQHHTRNNIQGFINEFAIKNPTI